MCTYKIYGKRHFLFMENGYIKKEKKPILSALLMMATCRFIEAILSKRLNRDPAC